MIRPTMTPEQQRIAIAEVCGWAFKADNPIRRAYKRPESMNWITTWTSKHNSNRGFRESYDITSWSDILCIIPDYLNDLNAMHEAESLHPNTFQYAEKLFHLVGGSYGPDGEHESSQTNFNLTHATASQRAEAFLKTLGLYNP